MVRPDPEQLETVPAAPNDAPAESASVTRSPAPRRRWLARYPNTYVWFIFLASLDILLTYLILHPILFAKDATMTESRGTEENTLANWVIETWDVPGMVVFKFILVIFVVLLCEIIGRQREATGRRLAEWAVAITSIPIVVALVQMGRDLYMWFYPTQ